jgi:hypothetical protein
MRFNPDADLDTSRVEWLYVSDNNSVIENALISLDIQPLTEGYNAMVEFFATFFQVAIVGIVILAVMALVAMRMDRQSAIAHRMGHRHNS